MVASGVPRREEESMGRATWCELCGHDMDIHVSTPSGERRICPFPPGDANYRSLREEEEAREEYRTEGWE